LAPIKYGLAEIAAVPFETDKSADQAMTTDGERPRRFLFFAAAILLTAAGALLFRLPRLEQRPMHTDESVHTAKAGILIEEGEYTYDPTEYHGPTIYYFALPFVWLSGATTLVDTSEWMFRIVPVIFGVGLVLLLLLVGDGMGRWAAVIAGILTAVSPAMVFYSRYYIQEMLLVFFTFGVFVCLWRYTQTRRYWWALPGGLCIGLMHATKETCIISFAAMAVAFTATFLWARSWDGIPLERRKVIRRRHVAAAVVIALCVSAPILTNFLRNPRAELDVWLTYASYLHRAGGAGIHDHPWHYYLKMLLFTKYAPGPWWSEGLILGLGLIGAVAALRRRPVEDGEWEKTRPVAFYRFVAFYAAFTIFVYSFIPYKTPWCMLSFLHATILLSGYGAVVLLRRTPTWPAKIVLAVLLALGAFQLGRQAYRANYVYYADTRNPYVYGHTSSDIFDLAERADDIAALAPEGHDMLVKVLTKDCWPLPWYLRHFTRVGYWPGPIDQPDAALIITALEFEEEVAGRLRDTYEVNYFGLRPEVLVAVFVRKDLWEAFIESRSVGG